MNKRDKQKIVIVGCGNVAWHIAKRLYSLKHFEFSVINHQENPALKDFAASFKCKTAVGLEQAPDDASVYFICVTDKYIAKVSDKLRIRNPNACVLHTSGSARLQELGARIQNTGVFYPLQSFSRDADIDWTNVPILTESADRDQEHHILYLADRFSNTVISTDYRSRLKIHLAAVLVNNFTNALYVSAFDLLNGGEMPPELNFELLFPLIEQTTEKIKNMEPRAAQTGPAKRNDKRVMKKHLDLIRGKDLEKVYKQLSKLIAEQQEK